MKGMGIGKRNFGMYLAFTCGLQTWLKAIKAASVILRPPLRI